MKNKGIGQVKPGLDNYCEKGPFKQNPMELSTRWSQKLMRSYSLLGLGVFPVATKSPICVLLVSCCTNKKIN